MPNTMFVKGPWTLNYGSSQFINTGVISYRGMTIADLSMEIRKCSESVALANAKVMSIAPELYEELEMAHRHRMNEPHYKYSETFERIERLLNIPV